VDKLVLTWVVAGSARPEVNESHPDGLDLSLFKDQAQLKKKREKGEKAKNSTSPKGKSKPSASSSSSSGSSEEESSSSEESSSEEEEEKKPAKQTKVVCTYCLSVK
jgi:U3 small nucleolar RNA-associated protein 14